MCSDFRAVSQEIAVLHVFGEKKDEQSGLRRV